MFAARRTLVRRVIASPLVALSCLLAVALPLVERADVPQATVLESEHDPARCPKPHQHRICTQASASHSAVSRRTDAWELTSIEWTSAPAAAAVLHGTQTARLERARAPPTG